jgi:hypothetical protein
MNVQFFGGQNLKMMSPKKSGDARGANNGGFEEPSSLNVNQADRKFSAKCQVLEFQFI